MFRSRGRHRTFRMTRSGAAALALLLPPFLPGSSPALADGPYITTVAGGGSDRVPALEASLGEPEAIARDGQGNIYIPLPAIGPPAVCTTTTPLVEIPRSVVTHVLRVDPAGRVTIVAGDGLEGTSGDGGPALAARFDYPVAIAADPAGNLYLGGLDTIRRIDAVSGLVTGFAGNGVTGYGGDGGPATSANLDLVLDLALDSGGNLYLADAGNARVRRIDAQTGIITTVAGNGVLGSGGDGGPATDASLAEPRSIEVDAAGNLFIGEGIKGGGNRIRRVDASTGTITTVAGNGLYLSLGDGGPATDASIRNPEGLAVDSQGNLFIADFPSDRIRRVDAATGIITSLSVPCNPSDVMVDEQEDLIVMGWCGRLYHVVPSTGAVTHLAGNGLMELAGDGGLAAGAVFNGPAALATGPTGDLFITDGMGRRVRRVDHATGIIETVAGGGTGGDGGPAVEASVRYAAGLAVDAVGNLFFSETMGDAFCTPSHRVRMVEASTGIISTIAGTGVGGFSGDGGPAAVATLSIPMGMAFDLAGDLFIADAGNRRVRRIDLATGIITTVAGNGQSGAGGDGGPATAASLSTPYGLAFDPDGNLYIADPGSDRVRRVDAGTGIITTVAGSGVRGFGGDGGPAELAQMDTPLSVAADSAGVLFIVDSGNNRLRRVEPLTGIIDTVAGDGTADFHGDTGPASNARLDLPYAVARGPDDTIYFSDNTNNRIRSISAQAPGAGSVPCEGWTPESPLTIAMEAGELRLSWGPSCLRTDLDYAVYKGSIGDWSGHGPLLCSTGGSRSITVASPPGDAYYLVVPQNLTHEGSYGRDGDGLERPPSLAACLPQEIAGGS